MQYVITLVREFRFLLFRSSGWLWESEVTIETWPFWCESALLLEGLVTKLLWTYTVGCFRWEWDIIFEVFPVSANMSLRQIWQTAIPLYTGFPFWSAWRPKYFLIWHFVPGCQQFGHCHFHRIVAALKNSSSLIDSVDNSTFLAAVSSAISTS